MSKPILVQTHERSGTHLVINLINYENFGKFATIGYIPKQKGRTYSKKEYIDTVYKHIHVYAHMPDIVCKSHHQVQFMEDYIDFVLSNFKVIYVERNIFDVLWSYYKFLFGKDREDIPTFDDWVFMKPSEVGQKYLLSSENHLHGPDPHIYVEPTNYIQRWQWHKEGWLKYKDRLLHITYEDILQNFTETKEKIEEYIGRKISDTIPDLHDKRFPNFAPNRGIVGGHNIDEKTQKIF